MTTPHSPLIPSFSPSSSSSSSSSASPFTPKALSPISGQRQRVIVSDYNRSSRQPDLISSRSISEISKQHLENEHKREFDRSDCENRDTVKKQDIHVDSHSSTADQQQEQSKTRKNTKVSAKLIKIPRPANSFMLYRAENSKKYPGLVATELSAKLGESWRNEPQEVRDRYEELAEQAKKEHAIRYPDYKFAPIKRGTGKRALKLAAEAIANEMAEMDAAALLISMASMAPTPAATIASSPVSCDRRPNPSRSPSLSTSVSATGTRPKAQRPLKASSLNSSNVSASHISKLGSPCNLQDFRPSNPIVSNVNHIMETSNAVNITTATESLQATNRAYPQLSPPLILFREALARRSPQLASSLVAQIVINVWFGVTDELRERYEALAENDPRFKDKIGQYVPHSQISNTPTTASEAMMANQIAQLLKKAAVTDQLTFPQSNKRKRAISTSNTAASKLEKLASTHVLANHAQASVKHTRSPSSNHIADSTCSKSEPMPLPMNGDTNSPPATFETSPTIPTKADSALPQETLPTPVSPKTSILHVVNDLAPENLIPMPMPSPNKRQAKASPGHVTYMTNSNPSRPKISMVPVSPESDKIDLHMMQTSPQENEMTTTNRPIRHISRPLKYSD
ncbi:hypothetical protein FBU30_004413 [Linnemannia zychae]|nr:hypothetical protein FBU30_004413 [Linnemannia zychae]